MTITKDLSTAQPFIAWSFAQKISAPSEMFRRSCDKHLRSTLTRLSPHLGAPAVEGIIVYDHIARGAAVASLLGQTGKTLPTDTQGETCDGHFDAGALADATNDFRVFARVHEGSRGMLLSLRENENRRLMLLDQRQVSLLLPAGREEYPERSLAATGLLAHELAHASDYADGRPGRPSPEEVSRRCTPAHGAAVTTIADMALAEYIATRAECAAQVSLQRACAAGLTDRAETMARHPFDIPPLDSGDPKASRDPDQRHMDLSQAGYTIGTLAAYDAAAAPVMGSSGAVLGHNTRDQVRRNLPKGGALGICLEKLGPALERAATRPDDAARGHLAETLETTLVAARSARRVRAQPLRKDPQIEER